MAVTALSQQLLFFSNSTTTRAKPKPWFSNKTAIFSPHKKACVSFIRCSSSSTSQSPETDAQTPESCVNLGLSLFSKGRVFMFTFYHLKIYTSSLTNIALVSCNRSFLMWVSWSGSSICVLHQN